MPYITVLESLWQRGVSLAYMYAFPPTNKLNFTVTASRREYGNYSLSYAAKIFTNHKLFKFLLLCHPGHFNQNILGLRMTFS